jgi:phosphatidylserine synthase
MDRRGEKIGWTGGWIGGFAWVLVFAILWIFQGRLIYGVTAAVLFFLAIISIVKLSPWKYPDTKYWKLMMPIYSIFLVSVIFIIYALNGFHDLSKIQYGLWLLPCFSPILIMGNKKWG